MFQRFWQADSTTTRIDGGLGLWLTLVRHLVELLHGGEVHAAIPDAIIRPDAAASATGDAAWSHSVDRR